MTGTKPFGSSLVQLVFEIIEKGKQLQLQLHERVTLLGHLSATRLVSIGTLRNKDVLYLKVKRELY